METVTASVSGALGLVATAVLASAALVHLYWGLGGRLGKALAIPRRAGGGGPAMRPRPVGTLAVAAALAIAALLVAARIGLVDSPMPVWLLRAACAVLALVFLARAIGERRYVGFFKRVKGTRFARLDTMVYAPLCLFMAVALGINAV
jgi:hypothetical protein